MSLHLRTAISVHPGFMVLDCPIRVCLFTATTAQAPRAVVSDRTCPLCLWSKLTSCGEAIKQAQQSVLTKCRVPQTGGRCATGASGEILLGRTVGAGFLRVGRRRRARVPSGAMMGLALLGLGPTVLVLKVKGRNSAAFLSHLCRSLKGAQTRSCCL